MRRYTALPDVPPARPEPMSPRLLPASTEPPLKNSFSVLTLALAATLSAGAVQASTIVWDQGPSTGDIGDEWSNTSDGQNFADSVTFASTTAVTGYNFFTDLDLTSDNGSSAFHLKVLTDAGGEPGSYLVQEDIGYATMTQLANGLTEISFVFSPIVLAAGQTYWVGVSGNGFEAGQYSVLGPNYDGMAQFNGSSFDFMATGVNGYTDVGDQMFQLTGVSGVPEPTGLALVAAGLGVAGFAARRRRRA